MKCTVHEIKQKMIYGSENKEIKECPISLNLSIIYKGGVTDTYFYSVTTGLKKY